MGEGEGFKIILTNFNGERLYVRRWRWALSAADEALSWAQQRKTLGWHWRTTRWCARSWT